MVKPTAPEYHIETPEERERNAKLQIMVLGEIAVGLLVKHCDALQKKLDLAESVLNSLVSRDCSKYVYEEGYMLDEGLYNMWKSSKSADEES